MDSITRENRNSRQSLYLLCAVSLASPVGLQVPSGFPDLSGFLGLSPCQTGLFLRNSLIPCTARTENEPLQLSGPLPLPRKPFPQGPDPRQARPEALAHRSVGGHVQGGTCRNTRIPYQRALPSCFTLVEESEMQLQNGTRRTFSRIVPFVRQVTELRTRLRLRHLQKQDRQMEPGQSRIPVLPPIWPTCAPSRANVRRLCHLKRFRTFLRSPHEG